MFCKESIWVEIKVQRDFCLLGLFYSPKTTDVNFFNNLDIEKAYDVSKNLIIVGDLNGDLLNSLFLQFRKLFIVKFSAKKTITTKLLVNLLVCTASTPDTISDHKATFIRTLYQYIINALLRLNLTQPSGISYFFLYTFFLKYLHQLWPWAEILCWSLFQS